MFRTCWPNLSALPQCRMYSTGFVAHGKHEFGIIEALRHEVDIVKAMQVRRLALSVYQVAGFGRRSKASPLIPT
jgi:hypothetical protein